MSDMKVCKECGWESQWDIMIGDDKVQLCKACMKMTEFVERERGDAND